MPRAHNRGQRCYLTMTAANDMTVAGSQVVAGGNAVLAAGKSLDEPGNHIAVSTNSTNFLVPP
ncbi:hypothetical protein [Desulfovibrio desulfuricans]|uniref:hypothetical protein n=1 Tax=Desulfovibrio desulfuricans TaxID=876 RepID=UPI001C02C18F|nr:hypothetical protein [Desulfovibrio desulfuricans]MBT9749102.1 hypothetical protein [Desulfovibrio desulfuricans]